MRYSLGLVGPDDMENVIKTSISMLKTGGLLIIELHRMDLLISNLNNMDIRERSFYDEYLKKEVKCNWPSGDIEWDWNNLKVKMPVTLNITSDEDKKERSFKTFSKEWIYTLRDFDYLLRKYNSFKISFLESSDVFPQSNLIILRRN